MHPQFAKLPPEEQAVAQRLLKELSERFARSIEAIRARYNVLPHRHQFSDTENSQFDKDRLALVVDILTYLKIYTASIKAYDSQTTEPLEKKWLESFSLGVKRELFIIFSFVLFNTSGEFRGKYKPYLGPSPFTWETFEHFGSIMFIEAGKPYNILQNSNQEHAEADLFLEISDKEHITEAMLDKIIDKDLDALIDFFKKVKAVHAGEASPSTLQNQNFLGIKALTRRVMDTKTFAQLLHLTSDYSPSKAENRKLTKKNNPSRLLNQYQITIRENYSERVQKESSVMYTHAALRRIEKIAELTTGKYFSNAWKNLDRKIDWNAITTLRDTIAHQDEGDNHVKVSALIQNKNDLVKILNLDLKELHQHLQKLYGIRKASEVIYQRADLEPFAQALLDKEVAAVEGQRLHNQNQGAQPVAQPRVRLTKEERIARRLAAEQAAAAARAAVQNQFEGLETIRNYAGKFQVRAILADCLTPVKRVKLALESLKNIVVFLRDEYGILINENSRANILGALQKDEYLSDAIQYNVLQFLQHLETIRNYDELKDHPSLANHYDSLRYFRNHIAHGALLIDNESYRVDQNYGQIPPSKREVADVIIKHTEDFIALFESAIEKMERGARPGPSRA